MGYSSRLSDSAPSVVLGPHCPVFPSWLRVDVCLRLRTALVSARRPCIAALLPWSGDGPNARNKVALGCAPGLLRVPRACVLAAWRSIPHQGRKRGSCSPTATIVSPSSAIVRRPGCVFLGTACGPYCSPCGLGGCVDPTHTGPLTEGDNGTWPASKEVAQCAAPVLLGFGGRKRQMFETASGAVR